MSLICSELITDVRQHVRQPDSANANLNDDDLLAYVNECTGYLSRELKTYQKSRLYDSAYVGSKLPLPSDCYRVQAVVDAAGYPLGPLTLTELRITSDTDGTCYGPTGWGEFGNHLWLAPSFQAVTLLYAGRVPRITDPSNTIDCPAVWDRAIVLYVARAYLRELESPRYQDYVDQFAHELQALKDAELDRHAPLPSSPRIPA